MDGLGLEETGIMGGAGISFMAILASELSVSGGGVAVPSSMVTGGFPTSKATPANIRAAAISANLRFPQAAGEGSGNLPRRLAAS